MTALDRFTTKVRAAWGPLTSDLVGECRRRLQDLADASPGEAWRTELRDSRPAREELCHDPDHGFVLLAHVEQAGLYRPPHDHGQAWVVYAVLEGEVEMRTFVRIEDADGMRLVQRDSAVLRPGQVQAYLPGDIHDTRCLSDQAMLLRFTERDLRAEAVTRYPAATGGWMTGR